MPYKNKIVVKYGKLFRFSSALLIVMATYAENVVAQQIPPIQVNFILSKTPKVSLQRKFQSVKASDSLIGKASIHISKLKFYVSDVGLEKKENKTVFLIDFMKADTIPVLLSATTISSSADSIYFKIGVDSFWQVAGMEEGVLSPLNDMYWTWNSGYITYKVEAAIAPNTYYGQDTALSITHHIGGYLQPYATQFWVGLPINHTAKKSGTINIFFDVDKLFSTKLPKPLHIQPRLMTVGADAVQYAQQFTSLFSIDNGKP